MDDLNKPEKREILFRESGNCCMLCGKHRSESDDWAMVQISKARRTKFVRIEGRTIVCLDCVGKKNKASVPDYAATLPFSGRFAYWWRIQKSFSKGNLTREKKDLLLTGFSLFSRYQAYNKPKQIKGNYRILVNETRCMCIYCGNPILPSAVTYDHIVLRSLGGRNGVENYVTACPDCNVDKSNIPVDEYVRSFPEKKLKAYVNRVNNLVRDGLLPEKKARLLLSFENEHSRRFRFRLFRRLFSVTITQSKI